MKKSVMSSLLLALAVGLAACSNAEESSMHAGHNMESMSQNHSTQPTNQEATGSIETLTGTEFTLTAKEATLQINEQTTLPVWTLNGSVPGPQIRVKQGDSVKINLKNELPNPVTIHWHGVPVPNNMDGIPGVTQNAVQPGETFTYEFKADVSGTYWYHSHQDGVNQLDKGLYGTFVVEGNEQKPNRDYTLVLDEWMSQPTEESEENSNMEGMDHSRMSNMQVMDHSQMGHGSNTAQVMPAMDHDMNMMYDVFTINGKSGSLVEPLKVKEGERVRIRLVNAGFMRQQIHLQGHEFAIVSTDGQPINNPPQIKDQLISIAPGERYDLEFTANNPGQWHIDSHGETEGVKGMTAIIQYEGAAQNEGTDQANKSADLPVVDMNNYGKAAKAKFTLDQKYTLQYTMNLGTATMDKGTVYTINDKTFPNTEPLKVKKGDLVKVRLVNNSEKDEHPMHLHGHFFQVLSKNGKPVQGSPIIKDTLNLEPGEEYVVAFEADNEGNWMFHCHDLHHASAGMVTELMYTDYKSNFVPDPSAGNKPE